jgi:hypothetical protein
MPTEAERERWAREYAYANPCLVCGRISRVIVLDLDGDEAHQTVLDRFGPLPPTWAVVSPGGEWRRHYYYRYPEQCGYVPNFAGGYDKSMSGVDLRGDGGCVLYPGSIHPSGGRYEFLAGYSPDERPLADPPEWLVRMVLEHHEAQVARKREFFVRAAVAERERAERLRSGREGAREEARRRQIAQATFAGCVSDVAGAGSGARNNTLFTKTARLASLVAGGYLNAAEVERAMEGAAHRCGLVRDDGIGSVRRTIASAMDRGSGELFTFPEPGAPYRERPRIALDRRVEERLRKAAREVA